MAEEEDNMDEILSSAMSGVAAFSSKDEYDTKEEEREAEVEMEGTGNIGAYAMVEGDGGSGRSHDDEVKEAIAAEDALVAAGHITVRDWLDEKYSARSDAFLRNQIRRLHADLDGNTYLRPAWKKNRHILTPDIDTQSFTGDMMMSNLYMTTRIPANWNDPELEEMSQTYLECGTMAWPGEEETDYNVVTPVWEYLQVPFAPKVVLKAMEELAIERGVTFEDLSHELGVVVSDIEKFDAGLRLSTTPAGSATGSGSFVELDDGGIVRWSTEPDSSDNDGNSNVSPESSDDNKNSLDIDKFFSQLSDSGTNDDYDNEEDEVPREITSPLEPTETNLQLISKSKFVTPSEWVDDNPEFANHVDFEHWSRHLTELPHKDDDDVNITPKEWYEADDSVWIDDIAVAHSVKHLIDATDDTLTDHVGIAEAIDDLKMWRRAIAFKFSGGVEGDQEEIEAIPAYLTPDKEDGVEYSDDLIEMKGRVTLAARVPRPLSSSPMTNSITMMNSLQ